MSYLTAETLDGLKQNRNEMTQFVTFNLKLRPGTPC